VSGYLFANNENDLAERIAHSGLLLVSAEEDKPGQRKKNIKLKSTQVLNFTINLSSLVKGGLRLLDSLDALARDTKEVELNSLILELKDYIEAGGSLKDALSLYPRTFSKLYISMVGAGEKTGRLDLALEEMVNYLEWQLDLRAKIIELATYPAIIFAVMLLVVGILVGWVLPRFEPILADLGTELPLPTKIVLGVSHFFTQFWYLFSVAPILLIAGIKMMLKNVKIRLNFDRLKFKVPIIGNLIYKICIARFCRSMDIGLTSGIGIIENIELSKNVVGNAALSNALLEIGESVSTGGQLSVSFGLTKLFPPLLIRMVEVGERSGDLAKGFKKVEEYYDKEIPRLIKRIFTLLEPLLIVFMGVVVGGIALSVFLPLVKMTESIGG
jgi:type IV pilus assembly protein PilC